MSAFAGGRLEFALRASHNDYRQDAGVVLQGREAVVVTEFERPGTEWTDYSVPLSTDERTVRETNLDGETVDQSTVAQVLSDLQALRISGEHSAEVQETVGLDEVRLVAA